MKQNMGTFDRIARILLALAFFGLFFTKVITGWLAAVLLVIACIFLITSVAGYCPLYKLFGIKTCLRKKTV